VRGGDVTGAWRQRDKGHDQAQAPLQRFYSAMLQRFYSALLQRFYSAVLQRCATALCYSASTALRLGASTALRVWRARIRAGVLTKLVRLTSESHQPD
jgi:hypothetical protein